MYAKRSQRFFCTNARLQRDRKTRLHVERLEEGSVLSGYALGPLVQVSGPISPFADSPTGQPGINYFNAEVEPWIAVDPTNPDHLVGSWQQDRWSSGGARGFVAAASFDGGSSWQQVVIPGLTVGSGGTFQGGADTWLSFAPNGDLHQICITASFNNSGNLADDAIQISKSTDGGLTWSNPIRVTESKNTGKFHDKPSITADPTDSDRVYAAWTETSGNRMVNARAKGVQTVDGGQAWPTPQTIHNSQGQDANAGHQIIVLPDGTLVDSFTEMLFSGGGFDGAEVSVIRSTDNGLTCAPRLAVGHAPVGRVSDPDTGQFVKSGPGPFGFHDIAVDPNTGNLYAVWQDSGFSAGQYNRIAFSMSTDGGLGWSTPIAINQTPAGIAPGNQQAFLPSVEVAADGAVGVTYYDFRNNTPAAGLPTDYWFIHAHPDTDLTDPSNWTEELRLTNTSFDLEQAPVALGGLNLGEYQGLATVGEDFVTFFTQPHDSDRASIFFRRIVAGDPLPAAAAGPKPGSAILDPAIDGAIWFDDTADYVRPTHGNDDRPLGQFAPIKLQLLTWHDRAHEISTLDTARAAGNSTSDARADDDWFAAVDSLLGDPDNGIGNVL